MSVIDFKYSDERFADIQMLRYRLDNFDRLTLKQKLLVYCLSQATLWGRDITFDQFGKYNLKIRKVLETIYLIYKGERECEDFNAFEIYLKRVWFANGIYHHYGSDKFVPGFSEDFFCKAFRELPESALPTDECQTAEELLKELVSVIFNPDVMPVKVNKKDGEDLVKTSACNFYENVSQKEVEEYYSSIKDADDDEPLSYGLNTSVVKKDGVISEETWYAEGKYGKAIKQIIYWLEQAADVADTGKQREIIESLIKYYRFGNLRDFNKYCIEWVGDCESPIDFINGFIEVYDDPLGMKGTWEGLVEYRDEEGTRRTKLISDNAQWFEDNSPVDPRFKKACVKGVSANVICAAMLGGGEYPSTAIGINLPNADWIRARHGSKSVTISNIISAYDEAARGNGFKEEFVIDAETIELIKKYGEIGDIIHTDLHECLGHGSGQLLPGVDPDALKAYGNTIEEARADLFGLYYAADAKLVELGLLPDMEAYKATYYTYIMNGMLTQLARIKKGNNIEEAHMRNRALISRWCYEEGKADNVIELVKRDGKTFVKVNSYEKLRALFARLLAEIQRIKSEGDYDAARQIVESYAVKVDADVHDEILARYKSLNIPPYKGFINPVLIPVKDENGNVTDVDVDYTESYEHQMLRYSKEYATLI
ncbi:MAG: dihydrofolate reductase [Prevotellaceae bacterium]|nr:dihydrofolate reductase [Prevotellaceae bacterium]